MAFQARTAVEIRGAEYGRARSSECRVPNHSTDAAFATPFNIVRRERILVSRNDEPVRYGERQRRAHFELARFERLDKLFTQCIDDPYQ
jgi:hypothetical protein